MTFYPLNLKFITTAALMFSVRIFGEVVLISEDFGGIATDGLNGKNASTFSSAITSAGGSSVWAAGTAFNADGSVDAGAATSGAAARLNLGSYINDRKGTATGKFSLTATLDPNSGGGSNFLSLGYFTGAIGLTDDFASDSNAYARATALTRVSSSNISEYFVGPGTSYSIDAINGRGLRTYTIVLDFTPAGGYDGSTNFGTIFFHSDNDGGTPATRTLNSNHSFQYIGMTRDDDVAGVFSDLQFTQIPEPSSLLLIVVAGMGIAVWRRR
ncbi:PEP-CTERM sorting domain-containing protein [Kiritimatiellaeota bacterium B1221]|nr:PEP-CTERM sorting domain-containing protein [Kiritimatiellaeota bacterium B1221]